MRGNILKWTGCPLLIGVSTVTNSGVRTLNRASGIMQNNLHNSPLSA